MDEKNANWQHWFDRHGAALILFARQRTSCYADAEDLVQSAFVRFWKHRQSAKDPLTYLYSCVTSAAHDQHRSDARRREREKNAWFVRAETESPVEPFEIEGALTTLPDEQREVLILKIWGELTFRRIAEVLSIPQNTAASRYRYAIEALKSQLSEEAET